MAALTLARVVRVAVAQGQPKPLGILVVRALLVKEVSVAMVRRLMLGVTRSVPAVAVPAVAVVMLSRLYWVARVARD
jgi:hypothetical protein